jgi:hypothetical protein
MAATFVGVDWSREGWLAVAFDDESYDHTEVFAEIGELWQYYEERDPRILVNIPIGLIESGAEQRACDQQARSVLGPLQSAVLTPPVREATRKRGYQAAKRTNERKTGTELSKAAFAISDKIAAVDDLKIPTIWLWPNMDAGSDAVSKGIRVYGEQNDQDFIRFFTSLPLEQYAVILNNASCIVGNSSSGIRESAYLGVPSVNIGNRQKGRQRGENVIDVPHEASEIKEAVKRQMQHGSYESSDIYGDGNSGQKVADILAEFEFAIQKEITY